MWQEIRLDNPSTQRQTQIDVIARAVYSVNGALYGLTSSIVLTFYYEALQ